MRIPEKLILNFFTKGYLKQADSFPLTILNPRMKSMICDLWFCMAIVMPFFLLFMIVFFIIQTFLNPEVEYLPNYLLVMMIPWLVMLFLILNKDIASGKSAGKRTFGFKVIDYKTEQGASQMQCMLRNITMIIWPLEVLMILITPQRRIGDLVANTRVIESEKIEINTLTKDLKSLDRLSPRLIIASLAISIVLSSIALVGTI